MFKFEENVQSVNSKVMVHMKNIEHPQPLGRNMATLTFEVGVWAQTYVSSVTPAVEKIYKSIFIV